MSDETTIVAKWRLIGNGTETEACTRFTRGLRALKLLDNTVIHNTVAGAAGGATRIALRGRQIFCQRF